MKDDYILKRQRILIILFIPFFWLISILISGITDINYWFSYWWLLPIALIISLLANIAGISSAALFVPFFILIFPLFGYKLVGIDAVRVGLLTESFGLTSSAFAFLAFGLVDKKIALYSIIGATPFVILGVFIAQSIPESIKLIMIAGLLLLSATFIFFEHRLKHKRGKEVEAGHVDLTDKASVLEEKIKSADIDMKTYHYTRSGYVKRFISQGIGGIFQGSTGFGIGEMSIISMMLTDIPIRIAIGTAHIIIAMTAILAVSLHFIANIDIIEIFPWNIPFVTIPAVIIAGQLAPYVSNRLSTHLLERIITILFLTIALSLLVLALTN